MKYEDALKEWGAQKLESTYRLKVDRKTVRVEMTFKEGYACCGGRDPDCYCSFAESPSASVEVSAAVGGRMYRYEIDHWSFNFTEVLREIVAAGGGTITSW